MSFLTQTVSFTVLALIASCHGCVHPPLATDYTNAGYSGVWYEIGRIQTPGGGFFQRNCVCDTANFTSEFPVIGDGSITYSCRQREVTGEVSDFSATLTAGQVPGNFLQQVFAFSRPVDYNVIWLDADSAIEYDCGNPALTEEYCIHFMSRTPVINPDKLEQMKQFADNLGLNTQNIEYKEVLQDGCWGEV